MHRPIHFDYQLNKRTFVILRFICIVIPICCLFPDRAKAHGDIHEQIDTVSTQIAADPTDFRLYMKRGNLYRQHQDWDQALASYESARAYHATWTDIDFLRAETMRSAGLNHAALVVYDTFLDTHPNHEQALLARAQTLANLGRNAEAASAYGNALRRMPNPSPDCFIEQANVNHRLGDHSITQALDGLDFGMQKIGIVAPLQQAAIGFELQLSNYDAALERLETLLLLPGRKEMMLAQKGDILALAGRAKDARIVYTRALELIDSLPDARRLAPMSDQLKMRIQDRLKKRTVSSSL